MFKFKLVLLIVNLIFVSHKSFTQNHKKDIYLKFEEKENCDRRMKFYNKSEKGIVFNLCCEKDGSVLFSENSRADTLNIKKLDSFEIQSMKEIKASDKNIQEDMLDKSQKSKDAKLPKAYNRNDFFNTYLIEIINQDKIVVYPVSWRHQTERIID